MPDRDDDHLIIEGKPSPRFRIFRFVNGEPHSLTGSYDTIEEVQKHKWRTDWDQRVYRSPGKYWTKREFDEWLKTQP